MILFISKPFLWRLVSPTMVVLTSLVSFHLMAASQSDILGRAYDIKTGDLLYMERYRRITDGRVDVDYLEPDSTVFATKALNVSVSSITPDFTQTNQRNGEVVAVRRVGGQVHISYQKNAENKEKTASIAAPPDLVIDAGFDAYIQRYGFALTGDEVKNVRFLVPSRQKTFRFQVQRSACLENSPLDAVCFSFAPMSWVIQLLVDPIIVAYDETEKRLLRFTGRSNIADQKGRYHQVDIFYEYE